MKCACFMALMLLMLIQLMPTISVAVLLELTVGGTLPLEIEIELTGKTGWDKHSIGK